MEIEVGGQSLLGHAAEHLRGAVETVALSVKADTSLPANHDFEIIYDIQSDDDKPSVAVALVSALGFAKDKGYAAILTLPVDTPFLPSDYAGAMIEAARGMTSVFAQHDGDMHGLHSLWKTSAYDKLYQHVMVEKNHRISALYNKPLSTFCAFTDVDKRHFLNINTPENLEIAQQHAAAS